VLNGRAAIPAEWCCVSSTGWEWRTAAARRLAGTASAFDLWQAEQASKKALAKIKPVDVEHLLAG